MSSNKDNWQDDKVILENSLKLLSHFNLRLPIRRRQKLWTAICVDANLVYFILAYYNIVHQLRAEI